jgi:AraC family transcriptional regulator
MKKVVLTGSNPQKAVPRLPHEPLLSSQLINWQGLSFREFNHPSYKTSEHVKDYHEIVVFLAPGVAQELKIDGHGYSGIRNAGEAVIIPSALTSSTAWTGNAEFALLTLSSKLIREAAYELIDPDFVELTPQYAIQDPLIYQMTLSLKQDIEAGCPTGKLFGESVATMLGARLLQQYAIRRLIQPSDEDGLSNYVLCQVLEYIQIHLEHDLSIAELAQMAGMSSYYFIRLFKKSMHITPRQYIIQQRIELAKVLLRSRELPIIEVASHCGFTSQSHFTTMFRKATKITPKAYRQGFE